MSKLIFDTEAYSDVIEEMKPLFENHWEEVAIHQDKIKLNPAYDQYQILYDAGMLHMVTARDEGKLVGYCVSFLKPHLHYADHIFAINDILFLLPEYRHAEAGIGLLLYTEAVLKDMGVSVITLHMKTQVPFDSLCEALEYENVEKVYSKFIGEEK